MSILYLPFIYEGVVQSYEIYLRTKYYNKAHKISRKLKKPLLVVGRPRFAHGLGPPLHGCGDICVDIEGCPECPKSKKADVTNLPFKDKQFGAVFCSHVLEHIKNPKKAIKELARVGNYVVILFPTKLSILARIHPGHHGESLEYLWKLGDGVIEIWNSRLIRR